MADLPRLNGLTVLEKGKVFAALHRSGGGPFDTYGDIAEAYDEVLTEDTIRGYAGRWNRQQADRQRQKARQLAIVEGGGKRARYDVPPVLLRQAVFDLETTDFDTHGYKGFLICCSILPLDTGEVQTYQIEYDDVDDRRVLAETLAALSQYDILIGHYINRFDLPWLASRVAHHNMPPFRRWFYIDTFTWARRAKLRTRKRLSTLIDFFGVEGIKTSVEETSWNQIRSRFPGEFQDARDDIVYHCEADVIANRAVFDRLYPRIMAARYSSSSPIGIFDQGAGVGMTVYEDDLRLASLMRRITNQQAAARQQARAA